MALKDAPKCSAKSKSTKKQCRAAAMPNGKCRMHGGMTPTGIASANFKTGRYSKYLPSQLAERFDIAQNDNELVQLRDEIALTDIYLSDRLQKLHSGEGEDFWWTLKQKMTRYEKALRDELMPVQYDESGKVIPTDNPDDVLTEMKEIINSGIEAHGIYEQVQPMIEQRRKLIDSEAKRLKDLDQNITVERAMAIIMLLTDIVKKYVTDRDQLASISRELNAAVGK